MVGKIEISWTLTSKVNSMPPSAEPGRAYRDHCRGVGQGLTGLQDHLRRRYVHLYGSLAELTTCWAGNLERALLYLTRPPRSDTFRGFSCIYRHDGKILQQSRHTKSI